MDKVDFLDLHKNFTTSELAALIVLASEQDSALFPNNPLIRSAIEKSKEIIVAVEIAAMELG